MENQIRINEIETELDKFKGLNIAKFAYCETARDFTVASYFNNSVEACIEITKNKLKFKKEHRSLNIFHSYILELIDLGGLN